MTELLKAEYGRTPLHYAARSNNYREVKRLLDRGAKVNAKDQHGQTPLHYAAVANGTKSAELLLDRGAKVDIKNTFNGTPLDLAKGNMKKTLSRHRGNHQSQGLQRGRRDNPSEFGQMTKVIRKELGPVKEALLKLTEATGERFENIETRQDNLDYETGERFENIETRQDNLDYKFKWAIGLTVVFIVVLIFSVS